ARRSTCDCARQEFGPMRPSRAGPLINKDTANMTTNAFSTPLRSPEGKTPSCRRVALTALAVAAGFLTFGRAHHATPQPDVAYVNGKIITADERFSIAQAVAIKDGTFVAVGSDERIRQLLAPQTRVIDLQGRTVVPGLMDAHTHMDGAGTVETT